MRDIIQKLQEIDSTQTSMFADQDVNAFASTMYYQGVKHGKEGKYASSLINFLKNKWPDIDDFSIDYLIEKYEDGVAQGKKLRSSAKDPRDTMYAEDAYQYEPPVNAVAPDEDADAFLEDPIAQALRQLDQPRTRTIINDIFKDVGHKLGPLYAKVLKLRFGMDNTDSEGKTLEEVGKIINKSRNEVRQLEARAIRFIRTHKKIKELEAVSESQETVIAEARPTRILELLGSKGIGSLPQVEKIINVHGQRDGMAALIRTTDGNAYEVVIRQAEKTTHPSLKKYTEALDEGRFGKAMGALAIAAALWGGGEMTSARHTPLGQALQQAAQAGDQEAAQHYKKLDVYVDSGNTAQLEALKEKYLGDQ